MSFRDRVLLGLTAAALLPLVLLAVGVRRQITSRVTAQHQRRVEALARIAMQDLTRESVSIDGRLASLARALADDNRFRLAALHDDPAERAYLLDWAGQAMRLTGLSMLQLQDGAGRIVSSGHFRNEYDRLDPELPQLLAVASDRVALVPARAPDGPFLVLARLDSLRVGDRRFTLVGGVTMDRSLLQRFARDEELSVSVVTPEGTVSADSLPPTAQATVAAELPLAYVDTRIRDSARIAPARLVVRQSPAELQALVHDVNRWFVVAVAAAVAGALALAFWLSAGLSRPIAALARAAGKVDLEGPEVELVTGRDDEIGALARRFAAMTRRLRASAVQLRDAERRATVGEMARQVNHDIKNGLIPIRNVLRHLAEVQQQRPAELSAVFGERRATLDSSIGYLDNLARSYARLTPPVERYAFDANAVLREVAGSAAGADGARIQVRLADALPPVFGDPLVLRRIVDNLLRNALESLGDQGGSVTLETAPGSDDITPTVRVSVADTGRGMFEQELAHAFDDFFTTKREGTGLGLSVVRRLTNDLDASLRVASQPGHGTTFTIDLPAAAPPGVPGGRARPQPASHPSRRPRR